LSGKETWRVLKKRNNSSSVERKGGGGARVRMNGGFTERKGRGPSCLLLTKKKIRGERKVSKKGRSWHKNLKKDIFQGKSV